VTIFCWGKSGVKIIGFRLAKIELVSGLVTVGAGNMLGLAKARFSALQYCRRRTSRDRKVGSDILARPGLVVSSSQANEP
jgi:hypothetical protein